ncbi:MAG: hypothetical protein K2N35_03530 [Muribaculaceae bacterium]|nr:hypothetical protein [Muribaculaceae bacterium]
MFISIKSKEVLADIRSAAWLESELHPELNRHRRHEMADICEDGNIERVWRIIGIQIAEIRLSLLKILHPEEHLSYSNSLLSPDSWQFRFLFPLPEDTMVFIKEKIHECLVAAVMADRTAVIVAAAADVWEERNVAALASLRQLAATTSHPRAPVGRPLWPL